MYTYNKNNKNIEKINQRNLIEKICDTAAIPHDQISAVLNSLEKNVSGRITRLLEKKNNQ